MGRHSTDFVSAIAGLLFLFFGAILVGGRVEADDFSAIWALPAVLIAIGLVVAAAAANRYKAARAVHPVESSRRFDGAPDESSSRLDRPVESSTRSDREEPPPNE